MLGAPIVTVLCAALAMLNVRGRSTAAYVLSPACDAVIVQLPAPVIWTESPVTTQLPLASKVTVRPEEAVALTAKSASPNVLSGSAANVIV